MKPLGLIVLGCLCVLSLPMVAWGKDSHSIEALVKHVDAQYAQLKDFQADFVQETRIQGFDTPLRSSGRVYLKKPGRPAGIIWNPRSSTCTCIKIGWRCTCPHIIKC